METPINLTKHSQRNLDVIMNFLLYAGLEDEYTKTAMDYIMEDHVDGEDSQEALLEIAERNELILEDIFLSDDKDEIFPCNVYVDKDNLIYVVSPMNHNEVTCYELTKPQEVIEVEHRDEILAYRLSKYNLDDFVSLGDIFMHKKYVRKLG